MPDCCTSFLLVFCLFVFFFPVSFLLCFFSLIFNFLFLFLISCILSLLGLSICFARNFKEKKIIKILSEALLDIGDQAQKLFYMYLAFVIIWRCLQGACDPLASKEANSRGLISL